MIVIIFTSITPWLKILPSTSSSFQMTVNFDLLIAFIGNIIFAEQRRLTLYSYIVFANELAAFQLHFLFSNHLLCLLLLHICSNVH